MKTKTQELIPKRPELKAKSPKLKTKTQELKPKRPELKTKIPELKTPESRHADAQTLS